MPSSPPLPAGRPAPDQSPSPSTVSRFAIAGVLTVLWAAAFYVTLTQLAGALALAYGN